MSWEYRDTLELIQMYKESPELWDTEHEDYYNNGLAEKIYRKMANRFKKTLGSVRRKIKSLRGMYHRQHKKIKEGKAKNIWFGYKPLSFLERIYDKKLYSNEEEAEEDDEGDEEDAINSHEESNPDENFAEESDNDVTNTSEIMWTRDDVTRLIEMYKDSPILWDTDHPNYHHKQMRLKIMKLIAENFSTSIPEVKNKIKNIRTMFLNMHKKVKNMIEEKGNCYGKVWYGYKLMGFLLKEGLPNLPNIDEEPSPSEGASWRTDINNLGCPDAKTHWDQRDFLQLIKLYEKQRLLWDPNDDNYNHKYERLESLRSLSNMLNKPQHEVESKIRNLRAQFFKNHKRVQENIASNGKPPSAVWFGYKPMMYLAFLADKTRDNKEKKVVVKKENYFYDDDNDSHVSTNSNEMLETSIKCEKKKRKYSESEDSDDPLEFVKKKSKKSKDCISKGNADRTKPDDEITVFGQFITQELRKLKNAYSLMFAKKQISEIVFQAQINEASISSDKQ